MPNRRHSLSRHWLRLITVALCSLTPLFASAQAQTIDGLWKINGNGHPGELAIVVRPDGTITGSAYQDRLLGYYASATREFVFLRVNQNVGPMQAYVGTISPDFSAMSGKFYGLRSISNGPERNVYYFAATRTSAPGTLPQRQADAKVAAVLQTMAIDANGWTGALSIDSHEANGEIRGHILGSEYIGNYSVEGTIAFVRYENGAPSQFYFGEATASDDLIASAFEGNFYALTPAAGATAQGFTYDWVSAPPPQENCSNGVDDDLDGQIDRTDRDCATAEECNGVDDDLNGVIDDSSACHSVEVTFDNVDDTGKVWLLPWNDNRETEVCSVDSGPYPRSGSCPLSASMSNRTTGDLGHFLVRLGNGGGGTSSGIVRVLIDGSEVLKFDEPKFTRGYGWFLEERFHIDFRTGTLTN